MGRQAQIPVIHASFVGSSGSAAVHKGDACARMQAPPRAYLRHGLFLHRRNRAVRGLDERGGRSSVDERCKDRLNSPCERVFVVRSLLTAARTILFLGRERRAAD